MEHFTEFDIKKLFETSSVVIGALITIFTFSKNIRKWAINKWKEWRLTKQKKREKPLMVYKMYTTINEMDVRIRKVEY